MAGKIPWWMDKSNSHLYLIDMLSYTNVNIYRITIYVTKMKLAWELEHGNRDSETCVLS